MEPIQTRKPKMRPSLLVVAIAISWCLPAASQELDYQFQLQAGTYSLSKSADGQSTESVSGIGAYSGYVGMGMWDHYLFFAGFSILASQVLTGSTAFGFDTGVRYYPWTSYGYRKYSQGPVSIVLAEVLRPYVGGAFRQRQFFEVLSSSYMGIGVLGGADYVIDDQWFANGEARVDYLLGQGGVSLMQMNLLVGVGRHF